MDNFFGSIYLTIIPNFISKFQDSNATELKANTKAFLAKNQHATHENHIKTCIACANVLCGCLGYSSSHDPHTTVLIWDTSASCVLKSFKSYFIDYVNCDITVEDVTEVITNIGIVTTIHKFVDANGKYVFLPSVYYHLPNTDVHFFSPQTYNHLHGDHSIIKGFNVKMVLKNHNIVIPINIQEPNLWIPNDISGFS